MSAVGDVYRGDRGVEFQRFLQNVISLANVGEDVMRLLMQPTSLEMYNVAFTHQSATIDGSNCYEFFEFFGDSVVNKCVMSTLVRRHSHMRSKESIKILARIKVNYVSKRWLSTFAETFLFWDFISAEKRFRETRKQKLLEDVFEAFFGATELLLDEQFGVGVGYFVCQRLFDRIIQHFDIDIRYEELFDAKTRLKELFDAIRFTQPSYEPITGPDTFQFECVLYYNKQRMVMGMGSGPQKTDAQQQASEQALEFLKTCCHTYREMNLTDARDDYKPLLHNHLQMYLDASYPSDT